MKDMHNAYEPKRQNQYVIYITINAQMKMIQEEYESVFTVIFDFYYITKTVLSPGKDQLTNNSNRTRVSGI